MLGRRLGAPVGAQRLPGGDGEAFSLARARARRAGPEAARGWLAGSRRLRWFPRSAPARAGRRDSACCSNLGSLASEKLQPSLCPRRQGSQQLLLGSKSAFNHAKLSGRWNESPKRGRALPALYPLNVGGGGEINPQSPVSWPAQRRLESGEGCSPGV